MLFGCVPCPVSGILKRPSLTLVPGDGGHEQGGSCWFGTPGLFGVAGKAFEYSRFLVHVGQQRVVLSAYGIDET
jgi:hypothetical protein